MKAKNESEGKEGKKIGKAERNGVTANRTKEMESEEEHHDLYSALVDKKTIAEFYVAYQSFENYDDEIPEVSRKVTT